LAAAQFDQVPAQGEHGVGAGSGAAIADQLMFGVAEDRFERSPARPARLALARIVEAGSAEKLVFEQVEGLGALAASRATKKVGPGLLDLERILAWRFVMEQDQVVFRAVGREGEFAHRRVFVDRPKVGDLNFWRGLVG
jgi:hypothetical protein